MALQKSGVELIASGLASFLSGMKQADAAQTALGQSAAAAAPKVSAVGAAAQGVTSVLSTLKTSLAAQNKELSTLEKDLTAASAAYTRASAQAERQAAAAEKIRAALANQNKELAIAEQELAKVSEKYGAASTQAQRKQLALDKLKGSIAANETALRTAVQAQEAETKAAVAATQAKERTAQAIAALKANIASSEAALKSETAAQQAAAEAAKAQAKAEADAAKATRDAGQAANAATPPIRDLGTSAQQAGQGFSAMREVAVGALREVGAATVTAMGQAAQAVGAFVVDSVGLAGDFEAGMLQFGAAAGDSLAASGKSVEDFKQLFLSLGSELPVSTAEVQEAATTLVKGGLDPAVLAAGGLKDSLLFAAAAGMDLNGAAELSIKTLGTFAPITATAAEQTAFLAEAQDLLVKAAGASTLNVDTLGDAMLQAGGQAKAAGVDYSDFVTTMGLISPAFGSAAEAGTSYKNFLVRLQPSTDPAAAAMQRLGLYTEETGSAFFDASGAFVGNQKAAELLQNALAGLSDAERVATLQTIFGNDAMGAAVALAAAGAEGYQTFADKMAAASGVQQQAQTVQQGFNIALDNAKGSLEALQITIGSALLPVLTTLFNSYISPGINTLTTLANAVTGNQEAFAQLSPTLQGIAVNIQAFAAAAQAIAPVILDFVTNSGALVPVLVGLATVVGGVLVAGFVALVAPIAATVAAITAAAGVAAVLYAAWQSNFAGIQGIVSTALSGVAGIVSSVLSTVTGFWNTYGAQIVATAQTTWGSIVTTVQTVIQALPAIVGPILAQVTAFWATHGADIQATVAQVWGQIGGIIQSTMAVIQAVVPPVLAAIGGFISSHGADIQAVLSGAWNAIKGVITTTLSFIQGIINTVLAAVQGDWIGAWTNLQNTSANLVQGLANIVADVLSTIPGIFSLVFGDAFNVLTGYVGQFRAIGADLINGMIEGIKSQAANVAAAAANVATAGISGAANAIMSRSPSRLAAEMVGIPISQGFAVGIIQGSAFAVGAGTQTARAIIAGAAGVATAEAPAIGAAIIQGLTVGLDADLSSAENQLALATQGLVINTSGMLGASAQTIGASIMEGAAVGVQDNASVLTAALETVGSDVQMGEAFAVGVAEGITEGAPVLQGAVEGLMVDATRSAQDILGSGGGGESQVAAQDIGAPFVEGIAAGITDGTSVIEGAAESIGQAGVDTMPQALAPAIEDSLQVIAQATPQFESAGRSLIAGMTGGVQAAAGALARAAAAAAKAALDAAKKELGIASPSEEAKQQVGAPFVAGIVEGIAASLTQIKGMARHLSKQLTEDMKKVAEEAAAAFQEVLKNELEADVGFSDTALSNFRKLQDLAGDSQTREAEQGIKDAEARLEDARKKQLDAEQDYQKKVRGLQQDAAEVERDRKDALRKAEADAAKERDQQLETDLAAIDERSNREIAAIESDSRLSMATKQQLIAQVRAQADADRAAAQQRAADATNDAALQEEMLRINKEYDDRLAEINERLYEASEAYDAQVASINEQVAALQKALDLAKARLNIEREMDERRRVNVANAQAQLDQAKAEADQIRTFDPKQADEYYKLRSKQILELADLENERIDAIARYATTGAPEDRDRIQALETERALLLANQQAERTLFAANAKANSPYKGLTDELTNLQNKLKAELTRDQGFYNLTDRNNVKMREKIAKEIADDQAALAQINALLAQVGQAAIGGGVEGVEGGAGALIAAMQAAFEQAKKATEATLGISSPSKVFAQDVGLPIIQGIAAGIVQGQQQLDRALSAVVAPPQPAAVRPAMSATQMANSYTYSNAVNIGSFSAANGVSRGEVQQMISDAMNRAGRTAYARRATA